MNCGQVLAKIFLSAALLLPLFDGALAADKIRVSISSLDAAFLTGGVTSPDPCRYEAAVADVVGRIAAGEIFQANVAHAWTGALARGARPFDLMGRLATSSPAPFAAYLRLPGRALVSGGSR